MASRSLDMDDAPLLSADAGSLLDDPHPDLLPSASSSSSAASSGTQAQHGSVSAGTGMHGAMTARYDKTTKLATGTTMEEYRRLNMQSTTVGMWGGIIAGGLISTYS